MAREGPECHTKDDGMEGRLPYEDGVWHVRAASAILWDCCHIRDATYNP